MGAAVLIRPHVCSRAAVLRLRIRIRCRREKVSQEASRARGRESGESHGVHAHHAAALHCIPLRPHRVPIAKNTYTLHKRPSLRHTLATLDTPTHVRTLRAPLRYGLWYVRAAQRPDIPLHPELRGVALISAEPR